MGIKVFYNLDCDFCNNSDVKPFTEVATWDMHGEEIPPDGWRFTGPDGIQIACSDACEEKAKAYWKDQLKKAAQANSN